VVVTFYRASWRHIQQEIAQYFLYSIFSIKLMLKLKQKLDILCMDSTEIIPWTSNDKLSTLVSG